jgi:hypothetical protein
VIETSGYTWIVPERATLADLQGGLDVLSGIHALRMSDVRILTVTPDRPVFVPAGLSLPNGDAAPTGVLTAHAIPGHGVVVRGEDR